MYESVCMCVYVGRCLPVVVCACLGMPVNACVCMCMSMNACMPKHVWWSVSGCVWLCLAVPGCAWLRLAVSGGGCMGLPAYVCACACIYLSGLLAAISVDIRLSSAYKIDAIMMMSYYDAK